MDDYDRLCDVCERNVVDIVSWSNGVRQCKHCRNKNKKFVNDDEDEMYNMLAKH